MHVNPAIHMEGHLQALAVIQFSGLEPSVSYHFNSNNLHQSLKEQFKLTTLIIYSLNHTGNLQIYRLLLYDILTIL